jgi:hypothetical protein
MAGTWVADLTVDALLISESMALLRLIPINDQAVTERQSCSAIGSTTMHVSSILCLRRRWDRPFIAVVERASESCLDMTDGGGLPAQLEL